MQVSSLLDVQATQTLLAPAAGIDAAVAASAPHTGLCCF
jgi:hypothetical protein